MQDENQPNQQPTQPSPTVDPIATPKTSVQSSGGNTSGQGSSAVVPEEVKGWSWGGFFLSWIWGTFNGITLSIRILALIVPFMNIVLGIKGREWAWQSKRWDSVEHFNQTQRKWAIAGALWVVIWVVISIILPVIMFKVLIEPVLKTQSAQEQNQFQQEESVPTFEFSID